MSIEYQLRLSFFSCLCADAVHVHAVRQVYHSDTAQRLITSSTFNNIPERAMESGILGH